MVSTKKRLHKKRASTRRKNTVKPLLCIDMQNFPPTTARDGVDFSEKTLNLIPIDSNQLNVMQN